MLELSSDFAREQRSRLARLKDGLAKTRSRLSGLFGGRVIAAREFVSAPLD